MEQPDVSLEEAAGPFLDGYAQGGGGSVGEGVLRARVAEALVRRAASLIRRLERNAVEKASLTLERARELAPEDLLV